MMTDETADRADAPAARRDVISLALGALPGVLLGGYVTGLLFFLNPELEPTGAALARGVVLYGALFGAATGLVLWAATRGRVEAARAVLPWALTATLAVAAAATWIHAYRFAQFLPPGINVRLVKAAVTLSVFALVAALTAWLHTLDRRRYGWRSRWLFAVLSVAVLWIMIERRAAFDPPTTATPLESFAVYRSRPELWVVGLDGATLDALLPLAEQGELPFFSRLLERGVSARLRTAPTITDATLWTTVATGHFPYRHRVVGERVYPRTALGIPGPLRLVPFGYRWWGFFGGEPEPTDARHRRHLTLWEMLGRLDIPAGVVGWPASHPPHEALSFGFSERYFAGDRGAADARPHDLAERGQLFRVAPEEISPERLVASGEPLPFPLLQALAEDLWRQSLLEFLLEQRSEVDALFLRLEGIAEASQRYYGAFARVHFEGAQDPARQEAARLLSAYYRQVDRFLAALDEQHPNPNRLLVVVSPYGFDAPSGLGRMFALAGDAALEGTRSGQPDGALIISGPGIRSGERLPEARAVDLLPSVLYALGLPIARDLDGRVLTNLFEPAFLGRRPLTFVPSYQTLTLEQAAPPGPELLGTERAAPDAAPLN